MGRSESKLKHMPTEKIDRLDIHSCVSKFPLVSLDTAVEPLKTILPSVDHFVRLVKEKYRSSVHSLTLDQSSAIMLATIQWRPIDRCFSFNLNRALSSNDEYQIGPWCYYLKLLYSGLDTLPSINRRSYRALPSNLQKKYSLNEVLVFPEIILTRNSLENIEKDLPETPKTMFVFYSFSAKDVSKYLFYEEDDLILFKPGIRFRIIQILNDPKKNCWIYLDEMPDYSLLNSTEEECKQVLQCSAAHLRSSYRSLKEFIDEQPHNGLLQVRMKVLSKEDMIYIVEKAIQNKNIHELWLNNVEMSPQCALILSQALFSNCVLKKLYLNDNSIDNRGVFYLSRALTTNNSNLTDLYLARNGIKNKGAEYLAEMLKTNQTLKTLSLYGNQIDDAGAKSLLDVLIYYNRTLESLYLSGNKGITDETVDFFTELFQTNTTLKRIHLFNCDFSPVAKEKLHRAIDDKSSIMLYI